MPDAPAKQPVYVGEFRHAMDSKHRVTIPSRWRRPGGAKDEFYLMPSPANDFISALPPAEIEKMNDRINNNPKFTDQAKRTYMRHYFSKAQIVSIDAQGRLLLPDDFCRLAGLDNELLLLGAFDRFEVWNPQRWEQNRTANEIDFQQMSRELGI